MKTFTIKEVVFILILSSLITLSCTSYVGGLLSDDKNKELPPIAVTSANVASEEQNNVEVYRSMSPGVVNITSTVAVENFFGVFPQQGTGSGSIIDNQGHILTNYHVVRNARKLDVTLSDKHTYRATLVGADPDTDIAIIKINAPATSLRVIPMGSSKDLAIGQKVLAIGNPFGLDRTLTTGVISGLDRPLKAEDGRIIENVIQTDASINPGNSGGPLLNKEGQLIGMNTAIYSPTGGSVGIGFAVPIDIAKQLLPDLIAQGSVQRGYLGIVTAPLTPVLANEFGIDIKEGAIVVRVESGGPADEAGLQGFPRENVLGDIILSVEGSSISESADLARIIGEHRPGDKIRLQVFRQGQTQDLTVTLGARPTETTRKKGVLDWIR